MLRSLLTRSLLICALSLAAIGLSPNAASADGEQLCRAFSTMFFAPTDILLAPYTVMDDMYWGMVDQDDSTEMKAVLAVPGFVFLTGLTVAGAIFRVAAGGLEIIPGMFTLFQDSSPNPLFTAQDESLAVYSEDFGPCPVRIGVHYNQINQ